MRAIWLTAAALLASACVDGTSPSVSVDETVSADDPTGDVLGTNGDPKRLLEVSRSQLGGPIPGLTPEELAAFNRGKIVFEHRFTPSEGLGPLYNATACVSCHSTPVTGGSAQLYRNFFIAVVDTPISQLAIPGLPSIVIPAFGKPPHATTQFTLEGGRFIIPETYLGLPVLTLQRNAIPIFGTGLFEFVSDATIMSNADPDDADGDGISGRFNTDPVGIGRFGVKLQSNNIELFTRPPLQNQMGITSAPFEGEDAAVSSSSSAVQGTIDPNDSNADDDGVPDPEISHGDLGDLIAFTRFLAPPAPRPMSDQSLEGQMLFEAVGCTGCHIPTLPSSRGPVNAYTDLLLHEMGPELADNLRQGSPQFSTISPDHTKGEFRTQPLWGVSLSAPFLHDGRAGTLTEAIMMHGGEATAARDNFDALRREEQKAIIAFLEDL